MFLQSKTTFWEKVGPKYNPDGGTNVGPNSALKNVVILVQSFHPIGCNFGPTFS
jgi:hypothetical protein